MLKVLVKEEVSLADYFTNQVYSLADENLKHPFCITAKMVKYEDTLSKNTFEVATEKKCLIMQIEIY